MYVYKTHHWTQVGKLALCRQFSKTGNWSACVLEVNLTHLTQTFFDSLCAGWYSRFCECVIAFHHLDCSIDLTQRIMNTFAWNAHFYWCCLLQTLTSHFCLDYPSLYGKISQDVGQTARTKQWMKFAVRVWVSVVCCLEMHSKVPTHWRLLRYTPRITSRWYHWCWRWCRDDRSRFHSTKSRHSKNRGATALSSPMFGMLHIANAKIIIRHFKIVHTNLQSSKANYSGFFISRI